MEAQLPFRIHIVDTIPTDSPEAEKYTRLFKAVLSPQDATEETLKEAARFPSEMISLTMIMNHEFCEEQFRSPGSYYRVIGEVIERALIDAKAEGVVWTPLIDALVKYEVWEHARAELPKLRTRIPSPSKYAEELIPWIKKEADYKSLSKLLKFESPVVHSMLAEHAVAVDDKLIYHIAKDAPMALFSLAKNPQLDAKMRTQLAFRCWDHIASDKRTTLGARPAPWMDRTSAREAFEFLVEHPDGIATEFKETFFARQELRVEDLIPDGECQILIALLKDVNLTNDEFGKIVELIRGHGMIMVATDPRCTEEQQDKIIGRQYFTSLLPELAKEPRASEGLLRRVYNRVKENWPPPAGFTELIKHPNFPEDIVDELFPSLVLSDEDSSLDWLEKPKFSDSPKYRRLFRGSRSLKVIMRLFEVSPANEFAETFLALYALHPMKAIRVLKNKRLIARLQLKAEDIAPLLSHEDSEVRLSAISFLPHCLPPDGAGQKPEARQTKRVTKKMT